MTDHLPTADMEASTTEVWSNWFGNETCYPLRIETPGSESELQELVAGAARTGLAVRAVGSGHSLPPIALTDGVLIDLMGLTGTIRVAAAESSVTAPGGMRLREIWHPLWHSGFAPRSMGELGAATVAGAVSTGVHGSGLGIPCMSATVSKLRLVLADGEVLEVSRETPELLRAAQISLGLLGVITAVTFDVVPAHDLRERTFFLSVEELLDRWDELAVIHKHFVFWYLPRPESGRFFTLPTAPAGKEIFVIARDPIALDEPKPTLEEGDRRDRAYRILTFDIDASRYRDLRDLEFAVPFDTAKATFVEMRERIRSRYPQALPIEMRFVAQDEAMLSPYSDGPRVVFGMVAKPDSDWRTFFEESAQHFRSAGGLPHWGKYQSLTATKLDRLFPAAQRFREIRRELDPSGVFLNQHLRPLFE